MRATLSGMVLLAIAMFSVTGGQPATSTVAMCSCPDCPNPVDAADSIVIGRGVSFDFERNADGSHVVVEQLGVRSKPVRVRIEVDTWYRNPRPWVIFVSATLYQWTDGEYRWSREGAQECGGSIQEDPVGIRVALALDVTWATGEWESFRLYTDGRGESFEEFRARLHTQLGIPLPPATGTGLAHRDDRDPNWLTPLVIVPSLLALGRRAVPAR